LDSNDFEILRLANALSALYPGASEENAARASSYVLKEQLRAA
jgi:hypothetical protein